MRVLKIPLIALVAVLALAVVTQAQIPPQLECTNTYLDCGDVAYSALDTIRIPDFTGRPGDTVWMPVYVKNVEVMSGFGLTVQWDENYLSPIITSTDTVQGYIHEYVDFELLGELLAAQERAWAADDGDFIFFAELDQSDAAADSNVIFCAFNTGVPQGEKQVIDPNNEVLFRLAFEVNASMQDGATTELVFFEMNEYFITDTALQEAYCVDCRLSQTSIDTVIDWTYCSDSVRIYDTLSTDPLQIDSTEWECTASYDSTNLVTKTRYPMPVNGYFQADNTPPPTIESFTTSDADDSVGTGDAVVFQWATSNIDSVVLFQGASTIHTSYDASSYVATNAPSTEGTYTYTLWAYNEYDSVSSSLSLLVQDGGVVDENAPVITVTAAFSVDVGTTLTFPVSCTDPDGDAVTLEATSLPSGAEFPTATGTGSASGTFTWTPGINQDGSHTAVFRATDITDRSSTATVTIVVNAPQYDLLFTSSVEGNAEGGLPGKTGIEFPINLVTSQTVYGIQFDFLYDPVNFEVTGVDVTDNTAEYVVYENIGVTPGDVRFIAFGMSNEPIGSEGTEVLMVRMSVDEAAAPGLYPIYIEDSWESINPDPEYPALPLENDSGIIQVDALGDVNLDTGINVADLVAVVGYIIGDFTLAARRFETADVNGDLSVDVFDLVAIVNLIYGLPVSPTAGEYLDDRFARIEVLYDDMIKGGNDFLTIQGDMPVDIAGAQMEILYDPAAVSLGQPIVTEDIPHINLVSQDNGEGRLTVLMYCSNPFHSEELILAGRSDLVQIPIHARESITSGDKAQLVLNRTLLAATDAAAVKVEGNDPLPTNFHLSQNYPNPFNPTTTISFTLGSPGSAGSHEVSLRVYNILGQGVNTLIEGSLPSGNHQVVWDSSDDSGQKVASGIYLYKLQVGDQSQTRKMVLLK